MRRPWLHGGFLLALSFAWLACEGDARTNDDDDGTGTGGGRTTATTGSGSNDCVSDGPCFPEGATCVDNGCCPCAYECNGGRWENAGCAGCAQVGCDELPPENGAPCDLCGPPACSYPQCDTVGYINAECIDARWVVQTTPCQ